MTNLEQTRHMWHVAGNLWSRSKSKVACFKLWRQNVKQRLATLEQSEVVACKGNSIGRRPCASSAASCGSEKCFKALWLNCLLQIPWQKFILRQVKHSLLKGTVELLRYVWGAFRKEHFKPAHFWGRQQLISSTGFFPCGSCAKPNGNSIRLRKKHPTFKFATCATRNMSVSWAQRFFLLYGPSPSPPLPSPSPPPSAPSPPPSAPSPPPLSPSPHLLFAWQFASLPLPCPQRQAPCPLALVHGKFQLTSCQQGISLSVLIAETFWGKTKQWRHFRKWGHTGMKTN